MRQRPSSPRGGGILVTPELQGDLKIIRGEVVKILHPSRHAVPGSPVGDAAVLGKLIDLGVTAGGAGVRHPRMVAGIDRGKAPEGHVIRTRGVLATILGC